MKEADKKHDSPLTSEKRHLRESLRHISHVRDDSSMIGGCDELKKKRRME